MEFTKETSNYNNKSYVSEHNTNNNSKRFNISNSKLIIKNNDDINSMTNNHQKIKLKSKNGQLKKNVKFKNENFVEIIKIESYKKYNLNNNYNNENEKGNNNCECNIL